MPSITGTSEKSNGLMPFRHATLTPHWFRVGAAPMVRVDAAPRAEVVLRDAGIEPINRQRLFAGVERNPADIGRHCHRATHPAIRRSISLESARYRSGTPLPFPLLY